MNALNMNPVADVVTEDYAALMAEIARWTAGAAYAHPAGWGRLVKSVNALVIPVKAMGALASWDSMIK